MPFDSAPVTSPVIEKLRRGRDTIKTRGLARGSIDDCLGRVCAVGAITRQSFFDCPENKLALGYLARAIPVNFGMIAVWNDMPGRTEDEVITAYDRAIDLAIADKLGSSL